MAEATVHGVGRDWRGAGHVTRAVSRAEPGDHGVREPTEQSRGLAARRGLRASGGESGSPSSNPAGSERLGTVPASARSGSAGPDVAQGIGRQRGRPLVETFAARRSTASRSAGCADARTSAFSTRRANCSSPGGSRSWSIIRGVNHYPQDIERTVQGRTRRCATAGGGVSGAEGMAAPEELGVVQEDEARSGIGAASRRSCRHWSAGIRGEAVTTLARRYSRRHVVLTGAGTLPKTTMRQNSARRGGVDLWLGDKLELLTADVGCAERE